MADIEDLITAEACCSFYHIEHSFIRSLSEYGLINIISVEEKQFIANAELQQLERFIRLHYDLGINLEGIDAIGHLLLKLKEMQGEILLLKDKLQIGDEPA